MLRVRTPVTRADAAGPGRLGRGGAGQVGAGRGGAGVERDGVMGFVLAG